MRLRLAGKRSSNSHKKALKRTKTERYDRIIPCLNTCPLGEWKSRYDSMQRAFFATLCAFLWPVHLPDLGLTDAHLGRHIFSA
jgi:hypothetical protein